MDVRTSPPSLQSFHGAKNLLDGLRRSRPAGGFPASLLVGLLRDHPLAVRRLVGGLPQRVVLSKSSLDFSLILIVV